MKVVIAYCPKDYEQASRLARWLQELGPYPTHSLLVVRDARCGGDLFNESGFGELEEIINPTVVDGPWPTGANFVFGMAARYIMDNDPQPWLFLEPDAIPMSKGWLDALVWEYGNAAKPFMGDDVNLPPERNVPRHMSGVAIYPGNLIEHGAGRGLNSYDIAWDIVIADSVLPRMHPTKLIEHAWLHPNFPDWESVEREVDLKHAVLFHSSKDGSLIDRLREKNLFPAPVLAEPSCDDLLKTVVSTPSEARESTKPSPNVPQEQREVRGQDSRGGGQIICEEKNLSGTPDEESKKPVVVDSQHELQPDNEKQGKPLASVVPSQIICDILIKTYPKDYEWLSYCLRGLEKFASGFRRIIIVYPFGEQPPNIDILDSVTLLPVKETGHNPYLFQQSIKFSAHEWTDAPYILHIDSDTVPCAPFTPSTFFRDGKPLWLMTPWDKISTPWREPTEKFLGCQVEYEFMRRFPILLPRSLHVAAAKFVELHHHKGATEYIVGQENFSEFNALGALAYGRVPEEFTWLDTTKEELPELVAIQSWSHGGLTDELRAKFESILSGSGSAPEVVNREATPIQQTLAGNGLSCSTAGENASTPVPPLPVQAPPSNGEATFADAARAHCDALLTLLKSSGGSFRSRRSMLLTELRKRRIVPPAKHKKK